MAGLSIQDLTLGVSHRGMEQWKSDLKSELLKESKRKIKDADNVEQKIKAGWTGKSEEQFEKMFKKSRETICDDLEKEYRHLEDRLEEVEDSYFDIDRQLMGGK